MSGTSTIRTPSGGFSTARDEDPGGSGHVAEPTLELARSLNSRRTSSAWTWTRSTNACIDGLHEIANRIALGLIVAALIVGAALLMQVPTSFRILGYPGLAILFFLAAALGGVVLVVSILASDRTPPEKKKRNR
jgi:hypothetical protein